ncbi:MULTISPECIES: phthiocerol/phthiodiolone dimycocerosyl transferase family protein [Nocardia]|uniref:phthiocerol/phthiodiolone dimycocerosyl transferase family protein n=1 Tax=Nocardia abscessus TaxID=120957 RepID=UPI0018949C5B|nr:acyltransferase [Nocardia abscessus]MBF6472156.1 acyltransferase [Nocardia abscessus]
MTAATVIRPLAPSEAIFANSEVLVGYSIRVDGRLDLAALSAAFEAVVRSRPILGARLEADGRGGHLLLESPDAAAEMTIAEGDPERLLTGARLDQRRALGSLCVVRDGAAAGVTLVTHHSVADAYHSLAVFDELWSCYTDLVRGRPPELEPHGFPRSVEDLLRERGVRKTDPPVMPHRPMGVAQMYSGPDDPDYLLPRTARCRLTREQTAALVELGHRENTTINGLASAAIMLTEAELRRLPLTDLAYTYSVDLRTRVTPPIAATEGTNVLGFANFVPAPRTGTSLVELARGISDTLRAGVDTGVVQQTPLHIPEIAAGPPPRAPGIVLATNWGRVRRPRVPDDLRITDFRSIMLGKPDKTGHRLQQPSGTIIISTFDDRLSIEIHHPEETTDEQRVRVRLLATHLSQFSAAGAA